MTGDVRVEGEPLQLMCEYCHNHYTIKVGVLEYTTEELAAMDCPRCRIPIFRASELIPLC